VIAVWDVRLPTSGGEAEHGALQDLRGVRGERSCATMTTGSRIAAIESTGRPARFSRTRWPICAGRVRAPAGTDPRSGGTSRGVLQHLVERPVRGELVLTDRPDRLLDQHRILEERQVDREDLMMFRCRIRHAVPDREDLLPGPGHRPLEGGDLLVDLVAADRGADRPGEDAVQEEPFPDRDPSRGRDPLEDAHLHAAFRHPPTPPRTFVRSDPRSPPGPLPHRARSPGSGSSCPSAPPASGRP